MKNKKAAPALALRGGRKDAGTSSKSRDAIIAGCRAFCNLLCAGGVGLAFGLTLCAAILKDGETLVLAAAFFAFAAFVGFAGEALDEKMRRK